MIKPDEKHLTARRDHAATTPEQLSSKKNQEFVLLSDKYAGWFYVYSVGNPEKKGYLPKSVFEQPERGKKYDEDDDQEDDDENQEVMSENPTVTTEYTQSSRMSSDFDDDSEGGSSSGKGGDFEEGNYLSGKPHVSQRLSYIMLAKKDYDLNFINAKVVMNGNRNLKPSILATFWDQSYGMLSKTVLPQFSATYLTFRDLIYDARKKSIKKIKTKCLVPITIKEVRHLPPLSNDIKVLNYKLRMSLYDKSTVLSNVYTMSTEVTDKGWKFDAVNHTPWANPNTQRQNILGRVFYLYLISLNNY